MAMLCIIDYGLGNVGSILNMCKHSRIPVVLSSKKEEICSATHLLIPGVGSFDTGMQNLKNNDLQQILSEEVIEKGKPVLGVCLGAQLMLDSSSEGITPGLGWVGGSCIEFEKTPGIKVPHMGWNSLNDIKDRTLFEEMPYDPPRFYFVHSYHFCLKDRDNISATTTYGREFTSAFRKNNIFGVQFHPEKSHMFGMQVLLNFTRTI
jgi:imidazole glycerol-phosphate synthase subunit HisH